MKLHYLHSSSVIIENNGVKILCDPWLASSAHYGSWEIYPPYDFNPKKFKDIDYIYISHIHHDHLHHPTLKLLDKKVPILIHNYSEKFVKNNLISLGFQVMELENNKRIHLKNNTYINIISADNCNPEICGKLLGCSNIESNYKTTAIDTMAFFDNGLETILNTNDCPYELIQLFLPSILKSYKKIDLMLLGYTGAGPFPQCFVMTEKEKLNAIKIKKLHYFQNALKLIEIVKPKFFFPFAGTYTLAGKFHTLNSYRSEPEIEEAAQYLQENVYNPNLKCIMLNQNEYLDISSSMTSKKYISIDQKKKQDYITKILSNKKYDYEYDSEPTEKEIIDLAKQAYLRFERTLKKIQYNSDTVILIKFLENMFIKLYCNGKGINFITKQEVDDESKYVKIFLDSRLLKRILQGPKQAHWNNAEGGSHLKFDRFPNIYERGLYHALSYFHK